MDPNLEKYPFKGPEARTQVSIKTSFASGGQVQAAQ